MSQPTIQPRYATPAAIDRLTEMLRLPSGDQDWHIEIADAARVSEFLDTYEAGGLDDDERFALMALIVASYDHLLQGGGDVDRRMWARMRRHLLDEFPLHAYTVQYWSLPDDDDDDPDHVFLFTALAREVMAAMYGPKELWPRQPFVVKRLIDRPDPAVPRSTFGSMEISDERDGSFELFWSTFRDRLYGSRRGFHSIADAEAFAAREFGVPPEQWQDL